MVTATDAAAALREQIASRAPQVVEEYRLRLTERLARLPIEPVDPARLAQEVALMADKCAIDEELSRLESHIAQMHVYLDVSGETGKKMDFLIQEMNRFLSLVITVNDDIKVISALTYNCNELLPACIQRSVIIHNAHVAVRCKRAIFSCTVRGCTVA